MTRSAADLQIRRPSGTALARRRGFTLVELLVVIGIIALLISILLPALSKAREQGNKTKCLAGLRSFGQMLQIYSNDWKGCVPLGYTTNKHAGYMVFQTNAYQVLGGLWDGGYLADSARAFFCPSIADTRWAWNNENNPWPPPLPGTNGSVLVRLGFTVRPVVEFVNTAPKPPPGSTQDAIEFRGGWPKLANLRKRAITAEMFGEPHNAAGVNVDPRILNHKGQINVLFDDGSANPVVTDTIDPLDGKSIDSILGQLYSMNAVPTSGTSPTQGQVYLDETVTPNTGIWHKFDQTRP